MSCIRTNMADAFESWAPREIRRLREEADVLQLAYDRFTAAQGGRKPRASNGESPAGEGQGRRSKYDALFVKWREASRAGPIGYEEMEQIAREIGFNLGKNLLRSTVHAAKKAGRVQAVGDGYVWKLPETAAASPDQEDAA